MGAAIEVKELNAWFGTTQALQDITMSVEANHATAIIGPSGSERT